MSNQCPYYLNVDFNEIRPRKFSNPLPMFTFLKLRCPLPFLRFQSKDYLMVLRQLAVKFLGSKKSHIFVNNLLELFKTVI